VIATVTVIGIAVTVHSIGDVSVMTALHRKFGRCALTAIRASDLTVDITRSEGVARRAQAGRVFEIVDRMRDGSLALARPVVDVAEMFHVKHFG
jgi:hypothetical protein